MRNEFECNLRFMNETNTDWDDFRLFLAVARHGGLHAAAHATKKSPPTLGRRMIALEHRLGQDLFIRSARGYALTADGTELFNKINVIEAELDPILQETTHQTVKISAGSWTTQALCQHADMLTTKTVNVAFIAADHMLDIARREAVIGIRNQRPHQIGLAGQRLGEVHFAGYARRDDLPWIKVDAITPSATWLSDKPGNITVSAPRNALDVALSGLGTALLPTFIGSQTDLTCVTQVPELSHERWLVSHHEARFQPQVRHVLTQIAKVLDNLDSC